MVRATLLISLLTCLVFGKPARADLILAPNFVDAAGQNWNLTTMGVVNRAIYDWKQVFTGVNGLSQTIAFEVTFANATASGYLGQWQGSYSATLGQDIRPWSPQVNHTIKFNADLMSDSLSNRLWFDPTPETDGDQLFGDWDALTVARHEIGHMLGFTTLYVDKVGTPAQTNPWTSRIVDNVFDPGGLNVAMNADHAHLALSTGDLMSHSLLNGVRIGISNQEAQMLSLAYGYDLAAVPEPSALVLIAYSLSGILIIRRRRPYQEFVST